VEISLQFHRWLSISISKKEMDGESSLGFGWTSLYICLHLIGAYALPLLDVFSWPCQPFFFVILQGKSIASCYFGDPLIATLFLCLQKASNFKWASALAWSLFLGWCSYNVPIACCWLLIASPLFLLLLSLYFRCIGICWKGLSNL